MRSVRSFIYKAYGVSIHNIFKVKVILSRILLNEQILYIQSEYRKRLERFS